MNIRLPEGLQIETVRGSAIRPYIEQLAQLRITVFRDYPYLYDGDMDYEASYLAVYPENPDSIVVLAFDTRGGSPALVGASTGLPLDAESDHFTAPFQDPQHYFYLGESVLLPQYRGFGIGVAFFQYREAHAVSLERFAWATFCGVIRPDKDPRRPPQYVPLDDFWRHRGYSLMPNHQSSLPWKEWDEPFPTEKRMQFWRKKL